MIYSDNSNSQNVSFFLYKIVKSVWEKTSFLDLIILWNVSNHDYKIVHLFSVAFTYWMLFTILIKAQKGVIPMFDNEKYKMINK